MADKVVPVRAVVPSPNASSRPLLFGFQNLFDLSHGLIGPTLIRLQAETKTPVDSPSGKPRCGILPTVTW